MKNKKVFVFAMALIILVVIGGCANNNEPVDMGAFSEKSTGEIYLYGEAHGNNKILEKELEIWGEYYQEQGMRHLFVELGYFTGELLNLWMESDDDYILEGVYDDWKGTQSHVPVVKEFYKKIKEEYPETIFHATDVGHQHQTTGQRFLKYLEENNLQDTEKYELTLEAIEQGKLFYEDRDHQYRENMMVENFIREFDKLEDENVMGIYGGAHTEFEGIAWGTKSLPSMASQLKKRYGDNIHTEDLSLLAKDIDPIRKDTIIINQTEYEAFYFGKVDLTGFKDYSYREFWRLEDAYDDFKDNSKRGDVLPYDNYPMLIETGQVFIIDYTKLDGSVERMYYRSDGKVWKGKDSTEGIMIE